MFALSKNYRSHQGILALASQVMDWLWKGIPASRNPAIRKDHETNWLGFPETIDKLGPEIGQYTGPRPVMFRKYSQE